MNRPAFLLVLAPLAALAACQKAPPAKPVPSGKSAALRTMEQIAVPAYKCWFASKDREFRAYRFANELNSMTGTPRFLLVPAKNYGGRPALVVQASGPSGRTEAFGPLMEGPLASRITADVNRWRLGDPSCGGAA